MTSWLEAVPALLVALVVLAVPGTLIVLLLRLRGLLAVAAIPAVSISIIAVSAIVGPWLGLRWGWWLPALGTAVVAGAVLVIRKLVPQLRRAAQRGSSATGRLGVERRVLGWGLTGAALAAVVIMGRLVVAVKNPEQISQNYDTVFHLNAVRSILDTGNGSSFAISWFMRTNNDPVFYPAAWHDLVSLLISLTGASIPAATNVMWVAVAAFVWPVGCVVLTRTLVGPNVPIVAAAGVLSASFASFPFLLLFYGTAYPNTVANSLVPLGIALVVMMLKAGPQPLAGPTVASMLLVLVLPGILLAQPNGVFSIAFILTPLLAMVVWAWLRRGFLHHSVRGLVRAAVLLVAAAVIAVALFSVPSFRRLFAFANAQQVPFLDAIWRGIWNMPLPTDAPAILVTGLVVFGLVVAWRRHRLGWLFFSVLLALVAYAFAVGSNWGIGNLLIAPWWGNPERIAAILPLASIPLAAIGLGTLAGMLARPLGTPARWLVPTATLVVGVLMITVSPPLRQIEAAITDVFRVPAVPNPLKQLDADELEMLGRLDDLVPADQMMANNPWNGSALAMALADRRVLVPYMSIFTLDDDQQILSTSLDQIADSVPVCDAARNKNLRFLLDFGTDFIAAQQYGRVQYPGIDAAATSGAFRLVSEVGHARLYELTRCASGLPGEPRSLAPVPAG
ncbi:DUF6541 family protein [Homoserinimonas sp. OAct 916]|uniref:DUF6541 family protein n=1 Tax=Homoserinimonas sp. OAct 916 TaxID=2211450 RepID=UPI000DBE8ACC|nr:DUF6541 family protein [Homoserinimonas sp. OAct 916]